LSFLKRANDRAYNLRFRLDNNRPVTFVPLRTVSIEAEKLPEYSGRYFSEELQRTFRLSVRRDSLAFTHPNAPTEPLRYLLYDTFKVGDIYLRFQRDKTDQITGFRMDAGRVRGLKFVKRTS